MEPLLFAEYTSQIKMAIPIGRNPSFNSVGAFSVFFDIYETIITFKLHIVTENIQYNSTVGRNGEDPKQTIATMNARNKIKKNTNNVPSVNISLILR